MVKSFCQFCNRKVDLMEVGFRRCFEEQRYKCSLCGESIRPKKTSIFNLIAILLILVIGIFAILNPVSSLAVSGTVDLDHEIGQIRSDFYGTNLGPAYWLNNVSGVLTSIDKGGDGVKESLSNSTWHREAVQQVGLKSFRIDSGMQYCYENMTCPTYFEKYSNVIDYVCSMNGTITYILGMMPSWLANHTTSCSSNNATCPPSNYTKWEQLIEINLGNATLSGLNAKCVNVEVWNEPFSSTFWLSNDNNVTNKTLKYITLYNYSYNKVKQLYPDMNVSFGAMTLNFSNTDYFFDTLMSNFTNKFDFINIHTGEDSGHANIPLSTLYNNQLNIINNTCLKYGSTKCSNIVVSEWGIYNKTLKNLTIHESEYRTSISDGYSYILNRNPQIALLNYHWSTPFKYANTSVYTGYPDMYDAVSEPFLDNKYYPPYNITKLFATNHKAGNTVINSTTNRSDLKIVASKDTTKYYITLTNTNDSTMNVTVDTGLENRHLRFYDVEENSTKYNIRSDGTISLTNVVGYDVITLASEPDTHQGIGSTCDNNTLLFYQIILNLAALALIGYIFYWGTKDGLDDLDVRKILIMGIGLVVGVILFQSSADNLGIAGCG